MDVSPLPFRPGRARSVRSMAWLAVVLLPLACTGAGDADAGGEAARTRDTAADAAGVEADGTAALPDLILVREPGLHPEGIEWDAAHGRFLIGSLTRGTITAVMDDGTHRPFAADDQLVASIGIHIDEERGRLLVANSDVAVFTGSSQGIAKLGVYALEDGDRLHMVDLGPLRPGIHFANDVTVDTAGNAYVTDSFAPVIYRVTPDGTPSILLEDERLGAEPVGLNGIDYHPDGFLLAAVAGSGELYRIPLDDPAALESVDLPHPIPIDGMAVRPDGSVAAVAAFPDTMGTSRTAVLHLASDDGWSSARVVARADVSKRAPTTLTLRGGAIYAVSAHLAELFEGGQEPVPAFEIFEVELVPAESPAAD